jgi:hypothetical protein
MPQLLEGDIVSSRGMLAQRTSMIAVRQILAGRVEEGSGRKHPSYGEFGDARLTLRSLAYNSSESKLIVQQRAPPRLDKATNAEEFRPVLHDPSKQRLYVSE